MNKKILTSDEFIGKKINVDGNNIEIHDVELISIEDKGIIVYDPKGNDGDGANYYISKNAIDTIDDATSDDEED